MFLSKSRSDSNRKEVMRWKGISEGASLAQRVYLDYPSQLLILITFPPFRVLPDREGGAVALFY